jgi:hypothetical protein
VANSGIEIRKIDLVDNYADPFMKALTSGDHHDFYVFCYCTLCSICFNLFATT